MFSHFENMLSLIAAGYKFKTKNEKSLLAENRYWFKVDFLIFVFNFTKLFPIFDRTSDFQHLFLRFYWKNYPWLFHFYGH